MKYFLSTLATFVVLCCSVNADYASNYEGEPPPGMPMISSLAKLTSYAETQVKVGYKSIWSNSMLIGLNDVTSISAQGSSMMDVLSKMQGEFRGHSDSPTDALSTWAFLADSRYNLMFYQAASATTSPDGYGGYLIVSPKLNMRLAQLVPIYFPNAINARIDYTDGDGNVSSVYLQVNNSMIYFPNLFSGAYTSADGKKKNGVLVVQTYYPNGGPALSPGDTYQTAYGLQDGVKKETYGIRGTIAAGVENCITADDKGLPPSYRVLMPLKATAASLDKSQIVNPPTGMVTITAPLGTKRIVTFTIVVPHDIQRMDLVEVCAYDPKMVAPDGSTEEHFCSIPTNSLNWNRSTLGGVTTVTLNATFALERDAITGDDAAGTDWYLYAVIPEYETPATPAPGTIIVGG